MNKQIHRTCIRMSTTEYEQLLKKSKAEGLSANAWLMQELETNSTRLFWVPETKAAIDFVDEVGREINVVARSFNSGCGTAQQLQFAVKRLALVVTRFRDLRKEGYPRAL